MEGATAGVGWWWGEVGGVVAGTDGAVANDGQLLKFYQLSELKASIRFGYDPLSEKLPPSWHASLQRNSACPGFRSSEQ